MAISWHISRVPQVYGARKYRSGSRRSRREKKQPPFRSLPISLLQKSLPVNPGPQSGYLTVCILYTGTHMPEGCQNRMVAESTRLRKKKKSSKNHEKPTVTCSFSLPCIARLALALESLHAPFGPTKWTGVSGNEFRLGYFSCWGCGGLLSCTSLRHKTSYRYMHLGHG